MNYQYQDGAGIWHGTTRLSLQHLGWKVIEEIKKARKNGKNVLRPDGIMITVRYVCASSQSLSK